MNRRHMCCTLVGLVTTSGCSSKTSIVRCKMLLQAEGRSGLMTSSGIVEVKIVDVSGGFRESNGSHITLRGEALPIPLPSASYLVLGITPIGVGAPFDSIFFRSLLANHPRGTDLTALPRGAATIVPADQMPRLYIVPKSDFRLAEEISPDRLRNDYGVYIKQLGVSVTGDLPTTQMSDIWPSLRRRRFLLDAQGREGQELGRDPVQSGLYFKRDYRDGEL